MQRYELKLQKDRIMNYPRRLAGAGINHFLARNADIIISDDVSISNRVTVVYDVCMTHLIDKHG